MLDIRPVREGDEAEWIRLRGLLWPECASERHSREIASFLHAETTGWSEPFLAIAAFVAVRPDGGLGGFLEASIRHHAEDCETWPVGYVEGWFVDADVRRQGVGGKLVSAAEEWAARYGCKEMASDAEIHNTGSLDAHKALGYEESARAIHLRKRLLGGGDRKSRPSTAQWNLSVMPDTLAVCKMNPTAPVPTWPVGGGFFSVTRTSDELSIVCEERLVPDGIACESGWRCLRVAGPIDFTVVGVLASLVTPLAKAGISVFAISTFDTDYLLVKARDLDQAIRALRRRGHGVR